MQKKGEARERRSSVVKCREIQFGGGGGRGGGGSCENPVGLHVRGSYGTC